MLNVKGLNKAYASFALKDVSFYLPAGCVMGFIGQNGAGKTTTLKSILNLVIPDSGRIEVFGKDIKTNETEIKEEIGYLTGPIDFYQMSKISKITRVYSRFFKLWDENLFNTYLTKFGIDKNKRIKELSSGMRTKLGLAMAMSHGARLLILDEPTSGLDPIARDELLGIFFDFVSDGQKSILFSTHITSDLDKCADLVTFIKNGEILFSSGKDDLLDSHRILRGKKSDLSDQLKRKAVGYKLTQTGFSALIKTDLLSTGGGLVIEKPTTDDIMIYYSKEA